MFLESSPFFVMLYERIDVFILIFTRMIAVFVMMPIFAGRNVPNTAKAGMAFFISFILFFNNIDYEIQEVTSFVQFVFLIAREFTIGYLMGFVVYLFFSVFYFAGQLLDYQIGFSMVNVLDPVSQIQVPITGNVLYWGATSLFIISGGLHVILDAIFYSYKAIPIGVLTNVFSKNIIGHIIYLTSAYFGYGVRIAAPVVGTVLLVDVSMGLLVKAVPQMNVFVVGMPIKLLVGLVIFYIMVPTLDPIFTDLFGYMSDSIYYIIEEIANGT